MPLPSDVALLLAAHGERRASADNDGVARLAAELARRRVAGEIAAGFIKGEPTIAQALAGFTAPRVLVYPLFLADGFFSRVRLRELVAAAAGSRPVRVLATLGLDPALVDVVAAKARAVAAQTGFASERTTVVLLAHGSSRDSASRAATELMAGRLAEQGAFLAVRTAFLEEPPSLAQAVAAISGPVAVVGLFAGEGLHGGADVPQLLDEIGRDALAFAGNIGRFTDLADIVAATVRAASTGATEQVD